jgi:hypothetical protein
MQPELPGHRLNDFLFTSKTVSSQTPKPTSGSSRSHPRRGLGHSGSDLEHRKRLFLGPSVLISAQPTHEATGVPLLNAMGELDVWNDGDEFLLSTLDERQHLSQS